MQTIYLIDDNAILFSGLCHVLQPNELSVKLFPDLDSFLAQYTQLSRGCLLIDSSKFTTDLASLQTTLNQHHVKLPSLLLTNPIDTMGIPMIIQAIKLGASNVIVKPFKNALLLESIHQALKTDQANHSQETVKQRVQQNFFKLTKREQQVMQLIINGESNKSMASLLAVTLKTIEAHRARVMAKMEVSSLAKLVKLAVQYELFENIPIYA